MGLFAKKCAYCGMAMEDYNQVERMGKRFCSDAHADKYWEYQKTSKDAHGGC